MISSLIFFIDSLSALTLTLVFYMAIQCWKSL